MLSAGSQTLLCPSCNIHAWYLIWKPISAHTDKVPIIMCIPPHRRNKDNWSDVEAASCLHEYKLWNSALRFTEQVSACRAECWQEGRGTRGRCQMVKTCQRRRHAEQQSEDQVTYRMLKVPGKPVNLYVICTLDKPACVNTLVLFFFVGTGTNSECCFSHVM